MHSRAILLLSALALVLLIIFGSVLLHRTVASAATEAPASERPVPHPAAALAAQTGTPVTADRVAPPPPAPPTGAGTRATADTLQWLLTRVHVLFEPYSADVTNEMIPYLADLITVLNQRDDLHYRLHIYEPDATLARRRAQTLDDVLRLNVLTPARLEITGQEGSHGTHVDVTS